LGATAASHNSNTPRRQLFARTILLVATSFAVSARPNLRRPISPRCGGKKRGAEDAGSGYIICTLVSSFLARWMACISIWRKQMCSQRGASRGGLSVECCAARANRTPHHREKCSSVCVYKSPISKDCWHRPREKEHRRAIQLCAIHPSWLRSHFRRDQTLRRVLRMIKFNFINYPSSWRRMSFAKARGFNRP
jgi:hypothetical protein